MHFDTGTSPKNEFGNVRAVNATVIAVDIVTPARRAAARRGRRSKGAGRGAGRVARSTISMIVVPYIPVDVHQSKCRHTFSRWLHIAFVTVNVSKSEWSLASTGW